MLNFSKRTRSKGSAHFTDWEHFQALCWWESVPRHLSYSSAQCQLETRWPLGTSSGKHQCRSPRAHISEEARHSHHLKKPPPTFGGYSSSHLCAHLCAHTLLHKRSKGSCCLFFFPLNNLCWISFCNFLNQVPIVGTGVWIWVLSNLKGTILNCYNKHH